MSNPTHIMTYEMMIAPCTTSEFIINIMTTKFIINFMILYCHTNLIQLSELVKMGSFKVNVLF